MFAAACSTLMPGFSRPNVNRNKPRRCSYQSKFGCTTSCIDIGIHTEGPPPRSVPVKPARRDADDRERRPVERQRLADDRGIGAEAPLPEAMADDGDRRRTATSSSGRNAAAERRLRAEQREIVAGDELRRDLLGFVARCSS